MGPQVWETLSLLVQIHVRVPPIKERSPKMGSLISPPQPINIITFKIRGNALNAIKIVIFPLPFKHLLSSRFCRSSHTISLAPLEVKFTSGDGRSSEQTPPEEKRPSKKNLFPLPYYNSILWFFISSTHSSFHLCFFYLHFRWNQHHSLSFFSSCVKTILFFFYIFLIFS